MLTTIDSGPSREGVLLGEGKDECIQGGVLAVTDNNWSNVFLQVGLMVQIGSMQCFLMAFDSIFLVILKTNLSEDSIGGVVEVMLTVDIEEGLGLWGETTGGDHLCGIEGFAHRYFFEVFYVVSEDELVVVGGKDSAAEVFDLDHGRLFKIMTLDRSC